MTIDDEVLHATENLWKQKQLAGAARCKQFELDNWMPREELADISAENYLTRRFYDPSDKKGMSHLRNMIASIMQSDKSTAGSSFEKATLHIAKENGVSIIAQPWINSSGSVCLGKSGSAHKIDGYISKELSPIDMKNCYIISQKTTLRERWNQDVWCTSLCIKVLLLTRETPNPSTLKSIEQQGVVVVYPHAPDTDYSWSYTTFIRKMKDFQQA
jgi:hypothetical protein